MIKDVNYELMPDYSIRQPFFEFNKIKKIIFSKSVEEINNEIVSICRNKIFQEAILIASRSLYFDMLKFVEGKIYSKKKRKEVKMSILKYILRMSTRATPFGIFAVTSIGNIENEKNKEVKYKKSIRPDFEWIMKLIKKLEKTYIDKLDFSKNNIVYRQAKYICIPYITGYECKEEKVYITNTIEEILDICNNKSLNYNEIYLKVKEKYTTYSKKQFYNEMNTLVDYEILISCLRPPINEKNILKYLILKLENKEINNDLLIDLKKLNLNFDEYIKNEYNNGNQILEKIHKIMEKIIYNERLTQVDLIDLNSKNIINKKNIDDITEFTNVFMQTLKIIKKSYFIYEEYKDLFFQKYGEYAEVPLCDMLNGNIGIGIPQSYIQSKAKRKGNKRYENEISLEFKKYFWNKYIDACKNNSAIILDDIVDFINKIKDDNKMNEMPNSIDLKFRISNNSEYLICGNDFGSIGAKRTLGRFSYIDKKVEKICKDTGIMNSNCENEICCDLSYIPNRIKMANITTNKNIYKYELSFYTNTKTKKKFRINIEDILVGIDNGKFYLKSKSLNKKINIRTNNLLYFHRECPLIRFLKEVELDGIVKWDNSLFKSLENFNYFPEIRYKSIIIRPEQWKIEYTDDAEFNSFEEFDVWFNKKRSDEKIPNMVFIVYGDNKLLINLDNVVLRNILFLEIKKRKNVILERCEDDFNDDKITELVVSLKNNIINYNQENDCNSKKNTEEDLKEKLKLPGSEWFYVKLYGIVDENNFIINELSFLVNDLLKKNIINQYHFVRYADPFKHLRIRLKGREINKNILYIINYLNEQIKEKKLLYYEINTYERELERYGGKIGMELAEKIFFQDSKIAQNILTTIREKNEIDKEVFCIISNMYLLKDFGMNTNEQFLWMNKKFDRTMYREEYNKQKKYIEEKVLKNNFLKSENSTRIMNLILMRESNILEYNEKIDKGLIKGNKNIIIESLIHMFFNKVFGMNKNLENKILAYTRHLLYDIDNKNKYLKKEMEKKEKAVIDNKTIDSENKIVKGIGEK